MGLVRLEERSINKYVIHYNLYADIICTQKTKIQSQSQSRKRNGSLWHKGFSRSVKVQYYITPYIGLLHTCFAGVWVKYFSALNSSDPLYVTEVSTV